MHSLKMMPSQELLLKPQLPFKAVLPLTKSRMRPRDALKSTSLTKTKRDSLTFPTTKSKHSRMRLERQSKESAKARKAKKAAKVATRMATKMVTTSEPNSKLI